MPDLILYRRHAPECRGVKRGRDHTKCKCVIWCDGPKDGRRVNKSMKTRDWDRAERLMLGAFDPNSPIVNRKLLEDAIESYVAAVRRATFEPRR